ncbi:NAD-dependent epimerase/dehydratase family protein, partial [Providencia manganoxydans]|uniref:NAD-dependent epimerase/dehydratase family protein n=1 Tax=Providencia manganoxydans TaxID=2923283 RepID=UPI0034E442A3
MKYLVTGSAGFIGSHVIKKLNMLGHEVIGIDNINDYYDVSLKLSRLEKIRHPLFKFIQVDIADLNSINQLVMDNDFDCVIHLAAQAGVRYSLENPFAYADSNLTGHLAILEGCRQAKIKHLVYASSSSVYGITDQT